VPLLAPAARCSSALEAGPASSGWRFVSAASRFFVIQLFIAAWVSLAAEKSDKIPT
jgi:hypothetical protein